MSDKPVLSMEDILTADDQSTVDVSVPEWGGVVKVKPFSKRQQMAIRHTAASGAQGGTIDVDEFERQVFLTGIVEPSFDESQYNLLLEKSALPMDRIVKEILRINGMAEDSEKETAATFQD